MASLTVSNKDLRFRFSIDRGGSFTDVYCESYTVEGTQSSKDRGQHVLKLLSEDPSNYADAPTEGIRRLLQQLTGVPHPRSSLVDTSQIDSIRMGTTVATNALLERNGERVALITTKGFADLQLIGNQSRPKIFDLEIRRPELLYEHVVEIDERVSLLKEGEDHGSVDGNDRIVTGMSHEKLIITKSLDIEEVKLRLSEILLLGIKSIAVVFLHSYTFSDHERAVREVAEKMGFVQISLSSEVMPMVRMVPRGCTTCVDAYLTPVIKRYLHSFSKGFDSNLMEKVQVTFMQSDGGLTPMNNFFGNRAILSGPAGGVVGYAKTSYNGTPVIGFDMGGTSTDVSRFAGTYEHVFESTTAGVTIQVSLSFLAYTHKSPPLNIPFHSLTISLLNWTLTPLLLVVDPDYSSGTGCLLWGPKVPGPTLGPYVTVKGVLWP
jgi:5-oxoprolinase (ATP-hydrolysing)